MYICIYKCIYTHIYIFMSEPHSLEQTRGAVYQPQLPESVRYYNVYGVNQVNFLGTRSTLL